MIEDDETIDVFNGVELGTTDHPAVAQRSAGKRRLGRFACLRTGSGPKLTCPCSSMACCSS
jgi:hypothetical protein